MQLEFVSPEEAAKWPEGTPFVAACPQRQGAPFYFIQAIGDPFIREIAEYTFGPATHFARLPDTLPEVEPNE